METNLQSNASDDSARIAGRRRLVSIVLALGAVGLFALGGGVVAATTLGGVSPNAFGADVSTVTACDSDGMSIQLTPSYVSTDGRYDITSVSVSGIAASCATQTLYVTLKNSSGTSIGNASVTVSSTSHTLTISQNPDANAVAGVAMAISA